MDPCFEEFIGDLICREVIVVLGQDIQDGAASLGNPLSACLETGNRVITKYLGILRVVLVVPITHFGSLMAVDVSPAVVVCVEVRGHRTGIGRNMPAAEVVLLELTHPVAELIDGVFALVGQR